jgi:hypothetical protein
LILKLRRTYSINARVLIRAFLLYLIISNIGSLAAHAQGSLSITGVIKDKKGEVIPGAAVYLSGYKIATVANNDGRFTIGNLKPGNYDLLIQVIGFGPQNKNVILFDKTVNVVIVLNENVTELSEVVIKPDPNRQRYIDMFKANFIGNTPNARQCKILNPEVIQTDYDPSKRLLTVTATDLLIIENKALGYRIKYLLNFFENDEKANVVFYSGHPHFEELERKESKWKKYAKPRAIAYSGSSQHFFSSLYHNRVKEEGFQIKKIAKIPNKNRPPDEVINANISRLSRTYYGDSKLNGAFTDSLRYWRNMRTEPATLSVLNRAEVLVDTLVKQLFSNVKSIAYNDALYVIYTNERETVEYTNLSGHSVNRPLDVPNYQISVVHQLLSPASFYENGGIFDPRALLYEGFWAYEKVADMVPVDYLPPSKF